MAIFVFIPLTLFLLNPFTKILLFVGAEFFCSATKSFISVTQTELEQLGFTIAKINTRMAKVTFDTEVIYALPKPRPAYVAERTQPVQEAAVIF